MANRGTFTALDALGTKPKSAKQGDLEVTVGQPVLGEHPASIVTIGDNLAQEKVAR